MRPPHGPRQLVRADRKTLFCGGQILWRGEWDSAAPVGLVLGLQGGEMEGLIRRESLGVGGDAPQGLWATQSYSDVSEVKHNKNCTSKTTSSSSGPAQYALLATLGHFLFIYICSTYKFDSICNILSLRVSEHCLWINLVHSMHLTEFTTNPTTTDCGNRILTCAEVLKPLSVGRGDSSHFPHIYNRRKTGRAGIVCSSVMVVPHMTFMHNEYP